MEPPNVVWIMCDQLGSFGTGCYGNSVVQTPNIDRLAREGMRFTNAYTPAPVCVPGRFAALTGRYPHNTGCVANNTPLPVSVRTGAHYFGAAGYTTAFIGKMHPVDPQTHGFDFLVDFGHYYDYLGPKVSVFARDMHAVDSGCGVPWVHTWYDHHGWDNKIDPQSEAMLHSEEVLAEPDHFEAFVARNCHEFFTRHGDRPFFLMASFLKPHHPWASPPEYHRLYDPEKMTLPQNALQWEDAAVFAGRNAKKDLDNPEGKSLAQQVMAAYYAATTYADECVGRILESLRELGLEENTVVVFTSDHGEMLYHHALRGKGVFYDEAAKVPLLVRWPGNIAAGTTASAITDLTDLVPTSLNLCGVQVSDKLDGRDLSPVLQQQQAEVRDACYSELPNRQMIRTRRWKLSKYRNHYQLFDMQADPSENENLYEQMAGSPEVKELQQELVEWSEIRP